MESKRDQILRTAWRLFESQGYHATGINQIIRESGVPKGSFYHYFPDGKEGLAREAIDAIGTALRQKLADACDENADCLSGMVSLTRTIAKHVEKSGFQHGGPLTTVALETATSNERLNEGCQAAYQGMLDLLIDRLSDEGVPADDAREISTMIIAGMEGAILLSRTFHDTAPLHHLAAQIDAIRRDRIAGQTL
jgi:TetR/AcrR family transcriptional regulator, lmrAB and yxaGH operons repressor